MSVLVSQAWKVNKQPELQTTQSANSIISTSYCFSMVVSAIAEMHSWWSTCLKKALCSQLPSSGLDSWTRCLGKLFMSQFCIKAIIWCLQRCLSFGGRFVTNNTLERGLTVSQDFMRSVSRISVSTFGQLSMKSITVWWMRWLSCCFASTVKMEPW